MADTAPQIIEAIRAEIEKKLGAERMRELAQERNVRDIAPAENAEKIIDGYFGLCVTRLRRKPISG